MHGTGRTVVVWPVKPRTVVPAMVQSRELRVWPQRVGRAEEIDELFLFGRGVGALERGRSGFVPGARRSGWSRPRRIGDLDLEIEEAA